jgi:hypothetical protein
MSYKRKRSRKPLTLEQAQLRMTDAVKKLEEIVMTSEDAYTKINAVNALSGIISKYAKLVETVELEERISALEKRSSTLKPVKTKHGS